METKPWRDLTLNALNERNRKERSVFEEIINTYARYQDQTEVLKTENTQLAVQNEKLRHENIELRARAPVGNGQYPDLQKKLYELQEEMTELLKKKGEHAQQVIDLRNLLELKEKDREAKELQLRDQQLVIEALRKEALQLREEAKELRVGTQLVRDEYAALHIAYESLERKNKKLESENDEVVARFISLKAEHAAMLNEENEQFLRQKREQMQRALQEAAREEIVVAIDDNEVAAGVAVASLPSKLINSFDAHDGEVHAVEWSSSSRFLVTGGADRKIKVWDFTGQSVNLRSMLCGNNMAVTSLCLDSTDGYVLAGSNDMSARVWTISDQRLRHTLTGHSAKVMAAKFLNGALNAATGSHDRTLKLWDLKKDCCLRTLFAGSSCNDLIASDAAATNIVSGHFDKKVRFWDTRADMTPTEIVLGGKITSLDLSTDRNYILCCVRDDTLKVIDVRANQALFTFCDDAFRVGYDFTRAKFSPDGEHVVVGSVDGSLLFWNTHTNKLDKKLRELTSPVICTSWSRTGEFVISGDKDRKVCIWSS